MPCGTLYAKSRSVQKNLQQFGDFLEILVRNELNEVPRKAFTAHSRESLMVAGQLTPPDAAPLVLPHFAGVAPMVLITWGERGFCGQSH